MSQPELPGTDGGSKSGHYPLLRRRSANKMPLKEKIVQIYEAFFQGEDPSAGNANFWEELFLLKVNMEFIESECEKLNGESLLALKDNFNLLFDKAVAALKDDNRIRIVNALHTLVALIRGMHMKNLGDSGFDVINILIGFDAAEYIMQSLVESLNHFLNGDYPMSLKKLILKFLQILATATDNISQNTLLEYILINSVYESLVQILASPLSRQTLGVDAVLVLTLLVQYRKYESANPYIVKLSILDDELALTGYAHIVSSALCDFNREYTMKTTEPQTGWFTALANMVGNMFVPEEKEVAAVRANDSILLALYEAIHLNRNFITALTHAHTPSTTTPPAPSPPPPSPAGDLQGPQFDTLPVEPPSQPTNLLVIFLEYSSVVMQYTKDETRYNNAKLCLVILNCIAEKYCKDGAEKPKLIESDERWWGEVYDIAIEQCIYEVIKSTKIDRKLLNQVITSLFKAMDQYANSLMHDVNMNFRVPLHRMPMRHRKIKVEKSPPSRPLACALLDLMVEFITSHLLKLFPLELYIRCLGIVHRVLCYQKRCRVRLQYPWKELWTTLINVLKFILSHESQLVKRNNIFHLASKVVNIFNLFITYGDTFLPNPNSYDELYYEIIRMHHVFDNLYSMALRYTTNEGDYKDSAVRLTNHLVNIRAIINHFNPKVDAWASNNHLSSLTEEQVLEVVRMNYDSLTLKLQDSLDQYERYTEKPRETAFFTQLVRSIIQDVRKPVSFLSLDQHEILQEFSAIL